MIPEGYRLSVSPDAILLRAARPAGLSYAAQTLRHYVDDLRKDPAIGPLFTTIALTTIERPEGADLLNFEIACKLKGAATP